MRNLCRAVIWSACFLELSDDDVVNPDSAVKAIEDIAGTMQGATREEKDAFVAACAEEAERIEKEGYPDSTRVADLIRSLPESLGLDEGEA